MERRMNDGGIYAHHHVVPFQSFCMFGTVERGIDPTVCERSAMSTLKPQPHSCVNAITVAERAMCEDARM
jgi:hypothetical protein